MASQVYQLDAVWMDLTHDAEYSSCKAEEADL